MEDSSVTTHLREVYSVCFMDKISLTSQDQEQTYKSLVEPEGAWK